MGAWLVDPQLDQISRLGENVKLEPRMVRLLARLAEKPGEVVSTRELLDSVWVGVVVGPASVYQAVSQLRKLLGDTDPNPAYIATVQRRGYRLVAPIERLGSIERAVASPPPPRRSPVVEFVPLVLLALIVLAVFGGISNISRASAAQITIAPMPWSDSNSRTIAVLPFTSDIDDAPSRDFGMVMEGLVRERLAMNSEIIVISGRSTDELAGKLFEAAEFSQKLKARFLMRGHVQNRSGRLHAEVAFVDALEGTPRWATQFDDDPVTIVTRLNELAVGVAVDLGVTDTPPARVRRLDLESYREWLLGDRDVDFMRQIPDVDAARDAFQRSARLDPGFARAHVGIGTVKLKTRPMDDPRNCQRARQDYVRALQLDATLGEAWVWLATCEPDAARAEEMYRKGLHLSPNFSAGFALYAFFLNQHHRSKESLEMWDRARVIDPLSKLVHFAKAGEVNANRYDFAEQKALLRQSLESDPDFAPGLINLAQINYQWGGDWAVAIRDSERAARDRNFREFALAFVIEMYLDVGEPAAAAEIADQLEDSALSRVRVALFNGDPSRAAVYARTQEDQAVFWALGSSKYPQALRDDAIRNGTIEAAARKLDALNELYLKLPAMRDSFNLGIICAHTRVLAGRTTEGQALARSILATIEQYDSGPPERRWWIRERAELFAILGEDERALDALEADQNRDRFLGWWYTAERDPVFDRIRKLPRFKVLAERARRHREQQRALLEDMRRKGEVPRRG